MRHVSRGKLRRLLLIKTQSTNGVSDVVELTQVQSTGSRLAAAAAAGHATAGTRVVGLKRLSIQPVRRCLLPSLQVLSFLLVICLRPT